MDEPTEEPAQQGRTCPCDICGRSFDETRVERHRLACAKAAKAKKHKPHDGRANRWRGTDAEQYVHRALKRGC